jgi:hypothetical protein
LVPEHSKQIHFGNDRKKSKGRFFTAFRMTSSLGFGIGV